MKQPGKKYRFVAAQKDVFKDTFVRYDGEIVTLKEHATQDRLDSNYPFDCETASGAHVLAYGSELHELPTVPSSIRLFDTDALKQELARRQAIRWAEAEVEDLKAKLAEAEKTLKEKVDAV